jgi:hypothetical protein
MAGGFEVLRIQCKTGICFSMRNRGRSLFYSQFSKAKLPKIIAADKLELFPGCGSMTNVLGWFTEW